MHRLADAAAYLVVGSLSATLAYELARFAKNALRLW